MELPVLWSFRRCPYAMRARLAVRSAGVRVALREIVLRAKPEGFLAASPSATVPCLQTGDLVLDESLDIMVWALRKADPERLLEMPEDGWDLIARCDGPFKTALDHTKYAVRYPDLDPVAERAKAAMFLRELNSMLATRPWLYAAHPCLADLAVLPFVRQFANTDRAWFDAQDWPHLRDWLDRFTASGDFAAIMGKPPQWVPGQPPVVFGARG